MLLEEGVHVVFGRAVADELCEVQVEGWGARFYKLHQGLFDLLDILPILHAKVDQPIWIVYLPLLKQITESLHIFAALIALYFFLQPDIGTAAFRHGHPVAAFTLH